LHEKYNILAAKQDRKDPHRLNFLPVSKAHANKFDIFQNSVYVPGTSAIFRTRTSSTRIYIKT
jgi:hypothetical protein